MRLPRPLSAALSGYEASVKKGIGTLVLGVIASLIAGWLSPYLGLQSTSGRGLVDLLLAPVPSLALFFYTVAGGALAWGISSRVRRHHQRSIDELRASLAATSERRNAEIQQLQLALAESKNQLAPRARLARRIVATIQSPPSGSAPTRDEICQAVVKADGNQFTLADVEDALGWMLAIQAIGSTFGKIQLSSGWQDRLGNEGREERGATSTG